MRNCSNCEYSYKKEDIELLGENDDLLSNFPEVGDCCISLTAQNGLCESHEYCQDYLNNDLVGKELVSKTEEPTLVRSLKIK